MKDKFKILSEETNRILELNSKLNKRISLNESTPRDLTVTVKDEKGKPAFSAAVVNPDTSTGELTDVNGKAILKNFSGTKIKVNFVGYAESIVDIQDSQNSVEVILNPADYVVQSQGSKKGLRAAKIQVVDSESKKPIEKIKIILTDIKTDEKIEKYTDEKGIFYFDYEYYKPLIFVSVLKKQQPFNLEKKEGEQVEKDKIFKTLEFDNFILLELKLKNSETNEIIPITKDILENIKVIVDDSTAINKKIDVSEGLIIRNDTTLILEFNLNYISDSTKLIVKLPGFLKTSVVVPSEIKGPIVVTLTAEVEDPERIKLPKGIRLGDVYESKTLYDVMRKYLGLCGEKYQEY
jgi:hypothetical protein